MAWLQNLAGRAEDILNKIDKNAAHVLNESNAVVLEKSDSSVIPVEINEEQSFRKSEFIPVENCNNMVDVKIDETDGFFVENEKVMHYFDRNESSSTLNQQLENDMPEKFILLETYLENNMKQECIDTSSKSSSLQNCFNLNEDIDEKLTKLEIKNKELNTELLNLRHLYAELQNDNINLRYQTDRANETVLIIQSEMEQYKARTQRILQEKEKLISLKKDVTFEKSDNINQFNEELEKKLEFQQQQNRELLEKLNFSTSEFAANQHNYMLLQKKHQQTNHQLQELITKERKLRIAAEEECCLKIKELQNAISKIAHLEILVDAKKQETIQLKEQLKQNFNYKMSNDDESRLVTLTQTLLAKQSSLETVTTERNALKLQLEKLENEFQKYLLQMQKSCANLSNVNDTDDVKSQVPQLMTPSPLDVGVTRRVKRAYSTLDAISIRSGVFLRRYPLARVFVFCYMVLLHIWVLIILFIYVPNNH